jgi:hypothetical protein
MPNSQSQFGNLIPTPEPDQGSPYAIKDMQEAAPANTPLPASVDTQDSASRALAMRSNVYTRGSGVNTGKTLINQTSGSHIGFHATADEEG